MCVCVCVIFWFLSTVFMFQRVSTTWCKESARTHIYIYICIYAHSCTAHLKMLTFKVPH